MVISFQVFGFQYFEYCCVFDYRNFYVIFLGNFFGEAFLSDFCGFSVDFYILLVKIKEIKDIVFDVEEFILLV